MRAPPLFVHIVHYRDSCLVLSLSLTSCLIAPSLTLSLSLCFRAPSPHGIRAVGGALLPPPSRRCFLRARPPLVGAPSFTHARPLLPPSRSSLSPLAFLLPRPPFGGVRSLAVLPCLLTQASCVFSPPAAPCGHPKVLLAPSLALLASFTETGILFIT